MPIYDPNRKYEIASTTSLPPQRSDLQEVISEVDKLHWSLQPRLRVTVVNDNSRILAGGAGGEIRIGVTQPHQPILLLYGIGCLLFDDCMRQPTPQVRATMTNFVGVASQGGFEQATARELFASAYCTWIASKLPADNQLRADVIRYTQVYAQGDPMFYAWGRESQAVAQKVEEVLALKDILK